MRNKDAERLDLLMSGELAPDQFNHRDHIAVAYEALERYEFFHATHLLADGLRSLANRACVPEKFNATVTLAAISLIAERKLKRVYESADAFIADNPEFFEPGFLTTQYAPERSDSELSRKIALLPSIQ